MAGVPDFHRRVYEAARRIGPGHTRTYGELAAELGEPGAARAVGQALGANPFAVIVPCHRVLAAGGRGGGFSAPGGVDTKLRLLEIERARIGHQPRSSMPPPRICGDGPRLPHEPRHRPLPPHATCSSSAPARPAAPRRITLARAGVDVVLVDQHAFPRDKVCGDGLIPDAHPRCAASACSTR